VDFQRYHLPWKECCEPRRSRTKQPSTAHAPVASLAGIDTIDSGAAKGGPARVMEKLRSQHQGVQDRQMQPSLLDIVGWATSTD
jgi:hypothetical protein